MQERKPPRPERNGRTAILVSRTVFPVPEERVIAGGKLDADLVRPSGVQADLDQRCVRAFRIAEHVVGKQCPLYILAGRVHDARLSKRAVIPEQVLHLTGSILEPSVHDGEIFFPEYVLPHLFG